MVESLLSKSHAFVKSGSVGLSVLFPEIAGTNETRNLALLGFKAVQGTCSSEWEAN